jgi:hypothetical protein
MDMQPSDLTSKELVELADARQTAGAVPQLETQRLKCEGFYPFSEVGLNLSGASLRA